MPQVLYLHPIVRALVVRPQAHNDDIAIVTFDPVLGNQV